MRKIFSFLTNTNGTAGVTLVNADTLEEAIKMAPFGSGYINSVGVDDLMKGLSLPTMSMVVQEEQAKPTLEQLAQLLRENGYSVTKSNDINFLNN